ncbi:MAG: M13 family metallopeptidase [Ignavibacteria bacterium]|nr:M13 family metallopeptidase [Ignavibacteria bacterium]
MKNLIKFTILIFIFTMSINLFSQEKYFLAENIDPTVNPADDFFQYANGTFIKMHPIPPYEHTYGIFNLVEDSVYVYLYNICLDAQNNTSAVKGSNTQKIGDFFYSGLDEASINKNDIKPLIEYLKKIDNVSNFAEAMELAVNLKQYGLGSFFSLYVSQDLMQSDKNVVSLYQGGIGLPERDYYFNKDARTGKIRTEYKKHIEKTFSLFNRKGGNDKISLSIFEIETDLASISRKLEDLRDDYANYNKMTVAELNKLTPSLDWKKLLGSIGIKNQDYIIVGQPEFFSGLEKLSGKYSIEDWKNYMKWNLVRNLSDYLSKDFEEEHFKFYGTTLNGTTEQKPRWKRVLDNTNEMLGDVLGMEYVRLYFPPEDKERTKQIVDLMVKSFGERIKKLDWMSDATKEKALVKLGTMVKKIGYPDKWKDYSTLNISRDSYVKNIINASKWHFEDNISKLYKPVDRTEWDMTPQTYNAYYNPSNNEIVLPAAILTIPGKKMSEVDDAFLFGFIGASTVGHEMTHGFDDQGRLYDEKGNLQGWWTPTDSVKFVDRTKLMVDQFNNYVVLDSMHINGKSTLGENIADLGGLVIGYDAMKMTKDGQENKEIGGFNADQRYFLGYAYSWAMYYRPEMLAKRVMTDVHSPAFLRVNAPFSNINEFYKAFNVSQNNKMFRPDNVRVSIW